MSELIILKHHRDSFHRLNLAAIEDASLTYGAKGLHTYLVSRPPGWKVFFEDLLKRSANGNSSLNSHLDELKEAGYLKIETIRINGGKFFGSRWTISEEAVAEWKQIPYPQKPDTEKPYTQNANAVKSHHTRNLRIRKNRNAEKPDTENASINQNHINQIKENQNGEGGTYNDPEINNEAPIYIVSTPSSSSSYEPLNGKSFSSYGEAIASLKKQEPQSDQVRSEETLPEKCPKEWRNYAPWTFMKYDRYELMIAKLWEEFKAEPKEAGHELHWLWAEKCRRVARSLRKKQDEESKEKMRGVVDRSVGKFNSDPPRGNNPDVNF